MRELGDFKGSLNYFERAINNATRYQSAHYWLHAEALIHRAVLYLKIGKKSLAEEDAMIAGRMFDLLGNEEGIHYTEKIRGKIKNGIA